MDRLEKYIKENRTAFDDRKPPERLWQQLDQQLGAKKNKRLVMWRGLRVAAGVLLLLGVGTLLGFYIANRNFAAENIASKLPDDFIEMETYYQKEINSKMKRLARYGTEKQSAERDIAQLDTALKELKKDILSAPKGSEEQIINAMIINYKTKIDLLETISEHINQNSQTIQKEKEKEDETINL